jgi:chlorobactene glucosyltransferase
MMWAIPFAYALFLLLLVYRYATRRPRLSDYAPQAAGPLVSVIIPARNEAVNIEECVRSAAATDYQAVEVIVVDDRSSDGTAEIVERMAAALEARGGVRVGVGVRLVRGAELPVGWFGKQWAMVQGYRAARGELLLFMDADTRQHPELIPRAVRALELERVDLLSVLSHQEMISFWERLVQRMSSSPSRRGWVTYGG